MCVLCTDVFTRAAGSSESNASARNRRVELAITR
jgi:hypothetical protein